MTLFFASAASFAPRVIERFGETNYIVTQYIEKSNGADETTRHIAWTEAINSIKRHGPWHSGLVAIKILGDGMIVFTVGKIFYQWLDKLFLFLRQICSYPKEELINQSSIVKDRVMALHKNITEMNKVVTATNSVPGRAVTTGGGVLISECADFRLSPTNLLKYLWKILTSSYSYVAQWLFSQKGELTFEMTKYAIQICGCISYYLEHLDKVWNFGLEPIIT
jgi:hypothetical protein